MKIERDSFVFYKSFYEAINQIEDAEHRAMIYDAICELALNGNEIELSGIPSIIFPLIKPQIEANNKRYLNGLKPKKKQNTSKSEAKTKRKRSKTQASNEQNTSKSEANVNENVNVNVNENVNVNVNDKEEEEINKEEIEEIYAYMNKKLSSSFLPDDETVLSYINQLFKKGYQVDDFKKVVSNCYDSWNGTQESQYLKPFVMFNPKYFNVNLNMRPKEKLRCMMTKEELEEVRKKEQEETEEQEAVTISDYKWWEET